MNRIRMDARWQDKLTGNSVSLDDVWKWRVIVIAWCEEGGIPNFRGRDTESPWTKWKVMTWNEK